jgi:hypothetical protein
MTTKGGKSSRTSRAPTTRVKTNAAKNKARSLKQEASDISQATTRFVNDLLVRGEAAKPDQQGKLPLDATHAITKKDTKKQKDGTVEVKRVRFKYY